MFSYFTFTPNRPALYKYTEQYTKTSFSIEERLFIYFYA
jgi:hypothetical protein